MMLVGYPISLWIMAMVVGYHLLNGYTQLVDV